jgi:hypothetical protein
MGENGSENWKKFLRKHWKIVALFVVAGILAFFGAIYVYLWFVADAQATGMVPSSLGLWTMGNLVKFILSLILWELILIGIPAILGSIVGWLWWRKLPGEEKMGYHLFGKRSRMTSGGNGISLLLFIAFCIKIYLDGNWNVAFSTWTLDYVANTVISILIWVLIIFGIPVAIGMIWWIHHEIKNKP